MVRRREFCRFGVGCIAGLAGCVTSDAEPEPIDVSPGDWTHLRGNDRRTASNGGSSPPSLGGDRSATPQIPTDERNDFRGTADDDYAGLPTEVVGTRDAYYVGERSGRLWSVSTDDMTVRWKTTISSGFHGIALGQERLFAGTTDGSVRAIDVTGTTHERFDLPTDEATHVTVTDDVVLASTESTLFGLDPELTEVRWSTGVSDGLYYPATDGDIVVFNTDSKLHAFSPAGEQMWSTATNVLSGMPVLGADHVFLSVTDSDVTAFSRADGSVSWQHQIDGEFITQLAVADRLYYVVGTGNRDDPPVLTAVSHTGSVEWQTSINAAAPEPVSDAMSPVVSGGSVYVATESAVFRYDNDSGEQQEKDETVQNRYTQRGFPFVNGDQFGTLQTHFERGLFKIVVRS